MAAQAIARRWRVLTPVLAALFLVAIPFNLAAFEPVVFGKGYMDQRRHVLTTAVRMPSTSASVMISWPSRLRAVTTIS